MTNPINLEATVTITSEQIIAMNIYIIDHKLDGYDEEHALMERIHEIEYVTETCTGHSVWALADLDTGDFDLAKIRLASVVRQIELLFGKYTS